MDPFTCKKKAHDIIAATATKRSCTGVGDCPQSRVGVNCRLIEDRGAARYVASHAMQSADVIIPHRLSVERLAVLGASAAQPHEAAGPYAKASSLKRWFRTTQINLCQPLLRMASSMDAASSRMLAIDAGERVLAAARQVQSWYLLHRRAMSFNECRHDKMDAYALIAAASLLRRGMKMVRGVMWASRGYHTSEKQQSQKLRA